MVLPSGMVIRVKEDVELDGNRNALQDVDSRSKENVGKGYQRKSDDLKKVSLSQRRKRKLSTKDNTNGESGSKISSFEVLQPASSKSGHVHGIPLSTPPYNYPALIQQLYHQLYQLQHQLQAQSQQGRSSCMPPPPPPAVFHSTGETYLSSSGQHLSLHQVPLGKGKDRSTTLLPGYAPNLPTRAYSQPRPSLGVSVSARAKRTPGTGRGRRTKNAEGKLTKKVCLCYGKTIYLRLFF